MFKDRCLVLTVKSVGAGSRDALIVQLSSGLLCAVARRIAQLLRMKHEPRDAAVFKEETCKLIVAEP